MDTGDVCQEKNQMANLFILRYNLHIKVFGKKLDIKEGSMLVY
jgi:hypothetical protein